MSWATEPTLLAGPGEVVAKFDCAQARGEEGQGGFVGLLDAVAVVNHLTDRHAVRQLRHATHVVAVKVRNQQIVDLGDPGVPHGRLNALGVAKIWSRPAGVHQHRFTIGRDHQSGGAPLDVDPVDVKGGWCLRVGGTCGGQRREKDEGDPTISGTDGRLCVRHDHLLSFLSRRARAVLSGIGVVMIRDG